MTFPAMRKLSTLLAILAFVSIAMPALADDDDRDHDRGRDRAREYRPYYAYPRGYYAYPPGYIYAPPPVYYAPPPPPPVAPSFSIVVPLQFR